MKKTLGIVLAAGLVVAGCGDGKDKKDKTVVVFAAASLTETFTALGKTFEASHPGVHVKFNFGGSSALAQQITQGAPVDVFAAASPATMTQSKLPGARTFVKNRLEIAVPPKNPGKVTGLKDLTDPKRKVVLCAPQVPCGAAAIKALGTMKVKPVSQEQDVKAALTKVELDEADAALVYKTDVQAAAGKVKGIDFPEAANAINDYPIADKSALGKEFTQLVLSPQGMQVLTQAGFEKP